MKNYILLTLWLFCSTFAFSQSIGITGYSASDNPGVGLSFVLDEDITAGTVVFITNADYVSTFENFVLGESDEVLKYTFEENKLEGEVVTIESSSLDLDCSQSSYCGSISLVQGVSWNFHRKEPISIFTDSDEDGDFKSGTINILSFASTFQYQGDIPSSATFPDAIIISGLSIFPQEFDRNKRSTDVTKSILQDNSNWGNLAGSATAFSTLAFASVSLPVELTTFEGYQELNAVYLRWETATEKNNKGFAIEKMLSKDNYQNEWETIGFVNGNGTTTSPKAYSFLDNDPQYGSNYYRLKQIDINGLINYSPIISIDFLIDAWDLDLPINVYPNPADEKINIFLDLENEQEAPQAIIYNLYGRVVDSFLLKKNTTKYNISQFPAGQYLLQITRTNGQKTMKSFIKTEN